jgi:phosphatidylethanolamine/phosphatidyl-N-methylethanolamine N-methyltransferase
VVGKSAANGVDRSFIRRAVPTDRAYTRREGDEIVVEPGAGTGVISRALLAGGVPAERLYVVEIVPDMAEHLRRVLPGVAVIEGDA